jgi:hypothetical protein
MIPVSTTARSATSSGGHSPPPHLPHRRLDVIEGECRAPEGLARDGECRFQPILGREHRQNSSGETGAAPRDMLEYGAVLPSWSSRQAELREPSSGC